MSFIPAPPSEARVREIIRDELRAAGVTPATVVPGATWREQIDRLAERYDDLSKLHDDCSARLDALVKLAGGES